MLITNSVCGDLMALFITFCVIFITYFKWQYQYWQKRNLQYLKPSMPLGTPAVTSDLKQHLGIKLKQVYDIMKEKKWKHGGVYIFHQPVYVVTDLDYLKNIMSRDFQYFSDRGMYYNEKADPITGHLFHIGGPKWKNLRRKFTPTFTSGKMKMMFQTLSDCEVNLRKQIELSCNLQDPIDIKKVLECFTTDIIGSCAFGLDCNNFEEKNSPFRVYGRKVFERSFFIMLKELFASTLPDLAKFLNISLVPKDISQFYVDLVKNTVDYRRKNKIVRNDFLQLLIDLKTKDDKEFLNKDGTSLTIEKIAAQSFVFFIAGFETFSTTMTFALYELARNEHIQDKVREEINSVLEKHEGKITYDAIQEMKYLEQVINEALRMYPPASLLSRKCVKNYKIPDTDVILEKGIMVLIPVLGIHHDKEYYPNPEKFDPDRFSEENKSLRHSCTHIPFGEGPRICIALRFGLLQSKVGLVSLLRNFKFTVNPKTLEPLEMKVNALVLAAKGEVWLNAQKI